MSRMGAELRHLLQALADLLFPPCCLACGTALPAGLPPLCCADCLARLPAIHAPICSCCGTPFQAGTSHLCGACLAKGPDFALARSPFCYEGVLRDALLGLKFHHNFSWLPSLGALCRNSALMADLAGPDLIVPVPLHVRRLRERGFNQSLLLARHCFPMWQDKIRSDLLVRTRYTTPQTALDGGARRRNLQHAFAADSEVAGKKILLVDDVFTTGTTVAACSQALLLAGAGLVEVFTPARSVQPLQRPPIPGTPQPAPAQSRQ